MQFFYRIWRQRLINSRITASEYTFFEKENIIKETFHPAEIIENNRMLIIYTNDIYKNKSALNPDEISGMISGLPQWGKTKYYRIFDNEKNMTYLTDGNFKYVESILPFKVVK